MPSTDWKQPGQRTHSVHAGTAMKDGQAVTVRATCAPCPSYGNKADALAQCYKVADMIDFKDRLYARDIGFDL